MKWNIAARLAFSNLLILSFGLHGGERGIRTPGTTRVAHTLSKRAPSASRTSLQSLLRKVYD